MHNSLQLSTFASNAPVSASKLVTVAPSWGQAQMSTGGKASRAVSKFRLSSDYPNQSRPTNHISIASTIMCQRISLTGLKTGSGVPDMSLCSRILRPSMPPARALPLPCFLSTAIGPIVRALCEPAAAASFSNRLRRFCRASSSCVATKLVDATGLVVENAALRWALGIALGLHLNQLDLVGVAQLPHFLRFAEVLFRLQTSTSSEERPGNRRREDLRFQLEICPIDCPHCLVREGLKDSLP